MNHHFTRYTPWFSISFTDLELDLLDNVALDWSSHSQIDDRLRLREAYTWIGERIRARNHLRKHGLLVTETATIEYQVLDALAELCGKDTRTKQIQEEINNLLNTTDTGAGDTP